MKRNRNPATGRGYNLKDIAGQRFGWLTAVRPTRPLYWLFLCDCGRRKQMLSRNVKAGKCVSCGCRWREGIGNATRTHGDRRSALYYRWVGMKARCTNPRDPQYRRYGGRGIRVCSRWLRSFVAFRDDMGAGFTAHVAKHGLRYTTIDRINNGGDYRPSNCRWATPKIQANNRRKPCRQR